MGKAVYIVVLSCQSGNKDMVCQLAFLDASFMVVSTTTFPLAELGKAVLAQNLQPLNFSVDKNTGAVVQDFGSFERFNCGKPASVSVATKQAAVILAQLVDASKKVVGYRLIQGKTGAIANMTTESILKFDEAWVKDGCGAFLQNGIIRNGAVCCYPHHKYPVLAGNFVASNGVVREVSVPNNASQANSTGISVDALLAGKCGDATSHVAWLQKDENYTKLILSCVKRLAQVAANPVQPDGKYTPVAIRTMANILNWLMPLSSTDATYVLDFLAVIREASHAATEECKLPKHLNQFTDEERNTLKELVNMLTYSTEFEASCPAYEGFFVMHYYNILTNNFKVLAHIK